jgi:hypothetical protein
MVKRVLFSLLITCWFALPMSGSQSTYNGPTLRVAYDGPIVVANSQLRYLGEDMLTFDTAEYLAQHAPNLSPLRPAIDTWAAMHAIHPRVLIHVLQAYWPLAATSATAGEKETVHQIATALGWGRQPMVGGCHAGRNGPGVVLVQRIGRPHGRLGDDLLSPGECPAHGPSAGGAQYRDLELR